MLSISLCVRLCVCSLLRYRLTVFLPPLPEVGCPISLEIRNSWGKVMERSGLRYEHFCLKIAVQGKGITFLQAWFFHHNFPTLPWTPLPYFFGVPGLLLIILWQVWDKEWAGEAQVKQIEFFLFNAYSVFCCCIIWIFNAWLMLHY